MGSNNFVEVGGLKWILENANVDDSFDGFYSFDKVSKTNTPTKEELERFIQCCNYRFDKIKKVGVFTDKQSGNSIELPANGSHLGCDGTLYSAGKTGRYWTSTKNGSRCAWYMYFNEKGIYLWYNFITERYNIRNVL